MTEIGIGGAGLVAAGWAGAKLLGPMFDEIAQDWRDRYSDHRKTNANRIGEKAQAKLGDRIEGKGSVPPRVALRVMEEGSWCDADVMSEYFGGILAASRSAEGLDDRGAVWAGLVSRLSTFDVYLHYLAYDAVARLFRGREDLNLGINTTRSECEVYLPAAQVLIAMKRPPTGEEWSAICMPSINALVREGLVEDRFTFGSREFLMERHKIDVPDSGFLFVPSVPGIELFLWAHGYTDSYPNALLEPDRTFEAVDDLGTVAGAIVTKPLKDEAKAKSKAERDEARAKAKAEKLNPS